MADDKEKKIEAFAELLKAKIIAGEFGTKGRLPTVTKIAKDNQMARATAYQSLSLLRVQGLLYTKGTSYYVNYPLLRIPGSPLFDKFLKAQGIVPKTTNLADPQLVAAPADVASSFGIQEGEQVIRRSRLQGSVDIPYRIHENWYPVALAGSFLEEMKADPDINVLGVVRQQTGKGVVNIHDSIITRLPTSEEMTLLNIIRTTPILEVRKEFKADDNTVIMFVKSILVGAFFELSYEYPHVRG